MKKFILYFIIIITSIIFAFVILDLINITSYVPFTNKYDWFGFLGGILGSSIGGIITYLGVYLTIRYQKNSDCEKNRLSIIPIMEYKISYDSDDFDNSNGQLADEGGATHINIENARYDDKKSYEWYFDIKAKNVGLGPAQITNLKFTIGDNSKVFIEEQNFGYEYKLIKCNEEKNLRFMIYAPKSRFKNNHISGKEFIYTIEIVIEYQDLLGNKYSQLIHAYITNSIAKLDKKIINRFNTAGLFYYDNFKIKNDK